MSTLKNRTIAAALQLLTLSAGCASPHKQLTRISVSPDYSAAQMAIVIEVADELCDAVPETCVDVVISSARKGGSIEPMARGKGPCPHGRAGATKFSPLHAPRMYTCGEMSERKFRWVVAHELGHAFTRDLGHLDYGHVMTPNFDEDLPTSYTPADLDYVAAGN